MDRENLFETVQTLAREQDLFAASAYLFGLGDELAIVDAFSHLILDCHHKAKSTEQIIHFGHAGINYCLLRAAIRAQSDPDGARQLMFAAKRMATNVASFTWPGWAAAGVTITPEQTKQGLIFARYSLRQLHALDPTDAKLGFTYWFLGAHLLADRQHQAALDAFAQARQHASKQCDNADGVTMLDGYMALTRILAGDAAAGDTAFRQAVDALQARGSEDAAFYAQQLVTAREVFEGQGKNADT